MGSPDLGNLLSRHDLHKLSEHLGRGDDLVSFQQLSQQTPRLPVTHKRGYQDISVHDNPQNLLRPILSASLPCTIVLKPESLARSAFVFSCNSHRSLETGLSALSPSAETQEIGRA